MVGVASCGWMLATTRSCGVLSMIWPMPSDPAGVAVREVDDEGPAVAAVADEVETRFAEDELFDAATGEPMVACDATALVDDWAESVVTLGDDDDVADDAGGPSVVTLPELARVAQVDGEATLAVVATD
jgi:hypothetical protein